MASWRYTPAQKKFTNSVPDYLTTSLTWLWRLRHKFPGEHRDIESLYKSLPFGAIVCVVDKTGCVSTNDDNGDDRSLTRQELGLGDYSANRFLLSDNQLPPVERASAGVRQPRHLHPAAAHR